MASIVSLTAVSSPVPFSHITLNNNYSTLLNSKQSSLPITLTRATTTNTSTTFADGRDGFPGSPLLEAAKHTVDTYLKSGMVIGLGSGLASGMAIEYLGQQLRSGALKDITGIPTSVSSASEAAKAGIPLGHYQDSSQIDFAFDDADVIEEGTLVAIIGRPRLQVEQSIIQEKSILNAADQLIFMIMENQYKGGPDGSVPVLVQALNWMETAEAIDDLFLGDAEVWRRSSFRQAGPLGGDFPVVTREGHNILDVIFTSPIVSLAEVAESLNDIDGVVDYGVVSKFPCKVVVASESGLCIVDSLLANAVEAAES